MYSAFIQLLIATLVEISVSTCFLPNGTALDDPWAQPCSSDPNNALHTVCCHTKCANPPGGDFRNGPTADECLPNGLCQNQGWSSVEGDKKDPWTHYYRVYCTNEEWSGCLSVCNTGLSAGDVAQLTPCDGTSTSAKWFCGASTDCCTSGNISEVLAIPHLLGSLTTESPSPTPSVANTKNSTSDKKRILGIGVGSGVGGGLGLLLLGIILWYCFRKRHKTGREILGSSGENVVELTDTPESRHRVVDRSSTHG